jgi:hypothetical protein
MERAVFEERVLDSEFLRRQLGCWLSAHKWKVPRVRSRALDVLCPSPCDDFTKSCTAIFRGTGVHTIIRQII